MGYQEAPGGGGGGKLSLASVSFAGPGAGSGGGGYKELLVMALPKDDGLDGAKVAEVIGVGMPDVAGAVRVSKSPPPLHPSSRVYAIFHTAGRMKGTKPLRFWSVTYTFPI
jgi:solute carrier family 25 phosphate transporter 23/24/25/41